MYGRRPYGVGMLVAGFDVSVYLVTTEYFACIGLCQIGQSSLFAQSQGPHLYQTSPSSTATAMELTF